MNSRREQTLRPGAGVGGEATYPPWGCSWAAWLAASKPQAAAWTARRGPRQAGKPSLRTAALGRQGKAAARWLGRQGSSAPGHRCAPPRCWPGPGRGSEAARSKPGNPGLREGQVPDAGVRAAPRRPLPSRGSGSRPSLRAEHSLLHQRLTVGSTPAVSHTAALALPAARYAPGSSADPSVVSPPNPNRLWLQAAFPILGQRS